MQKTAMFTVKRRAQPNLAAIVKYNADTGRAGRIIVSEPLPEHYSYQDMIDAARRLVPQAVGYDVVLPTGIELTD